MASEIIAVTLTEGATASVLNANCWIEVSFYHHSENPGDLVVTTRTGSVSADTGMVIPRQVPCPAIKLAPGTQVFATSMSGTRVLQAVVTPLPDYARLLDAIGRVIAAQPGVSAAVRPSMPAPVAAAGASGATSAQPKHVKAVRESVAARMMREATKDTRLRRRFPALAIEDALMDADVVVPYKSPKLPAASIYDDTVED